MRLKGPQKMTDLKTQDIKLTDQFAGHKSAEHENAGQKDSQRLHYDAVCSFFSPRIF